MACARRRLTAIVLLLLVLLTLWSFLQQWESLSDDVNHLGHNRRHPRPSSHPALDAVSFEEEEAKRRVQRQAVADAAAEAYARATGAQSTRGAAGAVPNPYAFASKGGGGGGIGGGRLRGAGAGGAGGGGGGGGGDRAKVGVAAVAAGGVGVGLPAVASMPWPVPPAVGGGIGRDARGGAAAAPSRTAEPPPLPAPLPPPPSPPPSELDLTCMRAFPPRSMDGGAMGMPPLPPQGGRGGEAGGVGSYLHQQERQQRRRQQQQQQQQDHSGIDAAVLWDPLWEHHAAPTGAGGARGHPLNGHAANPAVHLIRGERFVGVDLITGEASLRGGQAAHFDGRHIRGMEALPYAKTRELDLDTIDATLRLPGMLLVFSGTKTLTLVSSMKGSYGEGGVVLGGSVGKATVQSTLRFFDAMQARKRGTKTTSKTVGTSKGVDGGDEMGKEMENQGSSFAYGVDADSDMFPGLPEEEDDDDSGEEEDEDDEEEEEGDEDDGRGGSMTPVAKAAHSPCGATCTRRCPCPMSGAAPADVHASPLGQQEQSSRREERRRRGQR